MGPKRGPTFEEEEKEEGGLLTDVNSRVLRYADWCRRSLLYSSVTMDESEV